MISFILGALVGALVGIVIMAMVKVGDRDE